MTSLRTICAFLLLCALQALAQTNPVTTEPSPYGKTLLASYAAPSDVIRKFNDFRPSASDKGESAWVNSALADTVGWIGKPLTAEPAGSPYTIVLTLTGTARADGDMSSMWQAGWMLEDGMQKPQLLPGVAQNGVKAGQRITLTKAAPTSRFDETKTVSPVLAMVNAQNITIESAEMQIWSGFGKSSWLENFFPLGGLLTGLVFLAVVWWMRRS
jgi:hypothetical protein